MIERTGQNGIDMALRAAQAAETEQISAKVEYIAMMADIEMLESEEEEDE